ncbi:MAG: glycosyltransferase family 4 protein [Anaerolineales bacterium]|nr:glycosyltransferase family 4 protein [Chloroflexota bacterium]MBL6982983.1 glycosyltransferase family 4 protein [Anaerolineales bacterium]
MKRICVVPNVSGVGGMVSFRDKFKAGLQARGIEVVADLGHAACDAVLVIGGTRDLLGLWRAKRRGVRIVQRLNGMNWLHRQLNTGLRHYLRAEYGNWILKTIRSRLADHIIYQSEFSRDWWQRVYGPTPVSSSVVYNGIDLETYSPDGNSGLPYDRFRLLMVEGSLMGGYELGLETAVQLVEQLNAAHSQDLGKKVELMVVGRVAESIREQYADRLNPPILWRGLVDIDEIPEIDRSAHLLFASDINAACPNSVIEALACGLPVLSFDTGALPELVKGNAGRVVPYGGDPWKLEQPDIPALAQAAVEILMNQNHFKLDARVCAEDIFALDQMTNSYLENLLNH